MSLFSANVLGARAQLLLVLAHFFEHGRWGSPVQRGVEGHSLTAEDQLFILMQAATISDGYARTLSTGGANLLRARGVLVSFA